MDKEKLSQFSALSGIPEVYLMILQQAAIEKNVDLFFRKMNSAAQFLLLGQSSGKLNYEPFPKPSYIQYKTNPIGGHLMVSSEQICEINQKITQIFPGKKNAPQIVGNFSYSKASASSTLSEKLAQPELLTIVDVAGKKKVLTSDLDPLLIIHYLDRDDKTSSTYQSDYRDWSKYLSLKDYGSELNAGEIGGVGPLADYEILTHINKMTQKSNLTPIINHLTSATFFTDKSALENILHISRSGEMDFLETPKTIANKMQQIARDEKTVFLLKSDFYNQGKHSIYQDIHEIKAKSPILSPRSY